jgi:Leucine-rich repeat (LRR) protein
MSPTGPASFSSTLPVTVYIRPEDDPSADWQEFDRGPGIFNLPAGAEACIRIRNINDAVLGALVKELSGCTAITCLLLAENRNITNSGLAPLKALPQLTRLDLGSCSLTDDGLAHLKALPNLKDLGLSYCNRITDAGLKHLRGLTRLQKLDLQGCVKVTHGGVARLRRPGLEIHE